VGPRTGLDGFWTKDNISFLLGFEPRTVQPIASYNTDYVFPAAVYYCRAYENSILHVRRIWK